MQAKPSPLDAAPLPSTTLGQLAREDAPADPQPETAVDLRLPGDWSEQHKAEPWIAAAILTHSGWERDPARLVTEAEYEAARDAVLGLEIS